MTNVEFDEKVKCGSEYVAVRIIENCDELKIGNIVVTDSTSANDRLAFCKVEDIGKDAADRTGCAAGDYVMIDRLATFAHTAPVACLKYDSVICKANESNTEYSPLKDMLFVERDDNEEVAKVGNIYMMNPDEKLNVGTVTKVNFEASEEFPFVPGDKVMLSKGADEVQVGDKKIYIYKREMIVCKIVD